MLKLLRCAKQMMELEFDPDDNVNFWTHAKMTFNRRFHMMNTKLHSLALYLHPLCRKPAVTQVANGRIFEFMVQVALEVAKQWRWDWPQAVKLSNDLQAYNRSISPFSGGQKDGLKWWQDLPVNSADHPLKVFAITMLSIVGPGYHAISMHKMAVIAAQTSIHKPCYSSRVEYHVMLPLRSQRAIASATYQNDLDDALSSGARHIYSYTLSTMFVLRKLIRQSIGNPCLGDY